MYAVGLGIGAGDGLYDIAFGITHQGQSLAREIGLQAITAEQLKVGRHVSDRGRSRWWCRRRRDRFARALTGNERHRGARTHQET